MQYSLMPGVAMAMRLTSTAEMPTKAAFLEMPTSLFCSSSSTTPFCNSLQAKTSFTIVYLVICTTLEHLLHAHAGYIDAIGGCNRDQRHQATD